MRIISVVLFAAGCLDGDGVTVGVDVGEGSTGTDCLAFPGAVLRPTPDEPATVAVENRCEVPIEIRVELDDPDAAFAVSPASSVPPADSLPLTVTVTAGESGTYEAQLLVWETATDTEVGRIQVSALVP